MLRPAQFHTLEEMDALLTAVSDGLTAARAAIDAYTNERLQWVSDNGPEYRSAMGAAYLDARQAQDAIARMVDLTVLTFHPDRAQAAIAYGFQIEQVVNSLKLNTPAMRAAFGEEEPPPLDPPPEGDAQLAHAHGRHGQHKAGVSHR